MAKDPTGCETIDLFDWLESQIDSPEGHQNIRDFMCRNLRLNDRAANDESEMWTIFNRLNELCFMGDDENKIEAIGAEARADKARRIAALQKEFAEYKNRLSRLIDRELGMGEG